MLMDVDCIPFQETGYFSALICDYLEEKEGLKPFYNRFPHLENFEEQLLEKAASYHGDRAVLVEALHRQYANSKISEATGEKIDALASKNTYTVVTGHQLNLFTGPLYFLYKIISTINLTEELKENYPNYEFVPVYWMATEDHDFDEINYFNFKGKKVQWNKTANGAVGRLSTDGLEAILEVVTAQFGNTDFALKLTTLFKEAYLGHTNLTDATRYLANALFGNYGLVILDGDDPALKQSLVPYMHKDIFEQQAYKEVSVSINELSKLSESYKIQVNPREINYFYLKDRFRERILEKKGMFLINNTDIQFSREELVKEMEQHPERFSPNVIARPLYQEVLLPNLCYIGGGGELAYWLELKSYFERLNVTFPMLLLRNSALVITSKQQEKCKKLGVSETDIFLEQNTLINKKIREISNISIDFSPQKKTLDKQFEALYELTMETDKSFLGAVKAQEIKQKKGLDHLEKRLLKAQKRKLKDHVVRLTNLQNELFPNRLLQERQLNFSELYLEHGPNLIANLKEGLQPLVHQFSILRY